MLAGKRGSSSTVTMWRAAPCCSASVIATASAFSAPGEPSLATRILWNISRISLGDRRLRRRERFEDRSEPALRDQRRHDRAADDRGQQNGILALVDDVVGEAEQR